VKAQKGKRKRKDETRGGWEAERMRGGEGERMRG
jgi:hypothetical protein